MPRPGRAPIWGAALVLALVAAPAARADDFFGVTPGDELVNFSSLDTSVQAPLELTGLGVFDQVVALDVRPATGGLYGIVQGLTGSVRLVRIDQESGVVTTIGLPVTLSGASAGIGMDFDPIDDRVEVVTSGDDAFRLNPENGAVATLAAPPPTSDFVAFAYTPPGPGSIAVAVDSVSDKLFIGSGSGTVAEIGLLDENIGVTTSLDFGPSGRLWMYSTAPASRLSDITLATGFADEVGGVAPLTAMTARWTGAFELGAPTVAGAEADGTVVVTVRRLPPVDGRAQVAWATADGTAKAGADYTAASGELAFEPGESTATVSVPLLDDAVAEGGERFSVALSSVDGVPAGPAGSVVIVDDDPASAAPPPADTTAPAIARGGAATQRVLRQRGVFIVVTPTEAGTVTAKGRVSIRGSSKSLKLRPVTKQLADGRTATLKLTLKPKALTAIRRALEARKRPAAKVTVTATDAAGNLTTKSRTIKLKR